MSETGTWINSSRQSDFAFAISNSELIDALAAEHLGVNRTDLHCLNIIENSGGLTAGELASGAGLSTGVIDRLERVGYAHRVPDPADRRRVKVEVTPRFYANADRDGNRRGRGRSAADQGWHRRDYWWRGVNPTVIPPLRCSATRRPTRGHWSKTCPCSSRRVRS